MVNVSLDTLSSAFHVPLGTIQWVTSGYLLALALSLAVERLAGRPGRSAAHLSRLLRRLHRVLDAERLRRITIQLLILCRLLQGIAGGLLAPMMQMMMARHAGRHMARVIGVAAMPVMVGKCSVPVSAV